MLAIHKTDKSTFEDKNLHSTHQIRKEDLQVNVLYAADCEVAQTIFSNE